ncbi:MAG TPA: cell wall hydrolase [Bacillota bacterium]|nr:cell wall hydrolase [Bacillota bacterium]
MFNGFSTEIRKGVAGFIMACLVTATVSPLLIKENTKPALARVQHIVEAGHQAEASSQREIAQVKANEISKEQSNSGLNQSQVVTDQSRASAPTPEKNQGQPVDAYLLARVIHAEGRGEPFEGQVAIGAVLLNRLRDPRFPKSLQQIIFKQGEFCTVRDGQIWLPPNDESIRAAKLAIQGWDPTGGALYFYNPAKTTSKWIWSRPVTNHIGQHVFAA